MSKYLAVAAVMALAACGAKQDETPAADTTAVTTTTTVTTTTMTDTTMKTDTTKVAGDTTKTP